MPELCVSSLVDSLWLRGGAVQRSSTSQYTEEHRPSPRGGDAAPIDACIESNTAAARLGSRAALMRRLPP